MRKTISSRYNLLGKVDYSGVATKAKIAISFNHPDIADYTLNKAINTFTEMRKLNYLIKAKAISKLLQIGLSRNTITDIVINPQNSSVVYAATEKSGIYKPTNGGVSWEQFNEGLGEYAGAESGIYKSKDAGKTWFESSSGLPKDYIADIIIDMRDSNIIYIGTLENGGFKSKDAGATWVSLFENSLAKDTKCLAIDPYNSSIIYIGTDNGVFKLVQP